jgi:phosphatidylinositol glycan class Q protein
MAEQYLAVDLIHSSLTWLDNWPVGLKLNTQLSRFFCLLFMGLTDLWGRTCFSFPMSCVLVYSLLSDCLSITAPYFPSIIYFIGTSGRLGLTMVLSLLSDLLGILTFHLYICYLIGTAIFSVQLTTAGSLYNLFRGMLSGCPLSITDNLL